MKHVLLIGIEGVYNYGCEAIVRGTVEILRNYNSKIDITYASYNYDYDRNRLSDLNINIVQRYRSKKKWTIKNIRNKLLSILNILPNKFDNTNFVKDYDIIFSIGGDMYTLSQNGSFYYALPVFIEKCLKKNPKMKYVLWGASVGPFTGNRKAEEFYKKHLRKADLIVAREAATIEYLKTIGINSNVVFGPDPAFFVPSESQKVSRDNNDKLLLGINLSPLSSLYKYGSIEKGIEIQSRAIESLIKNINANIVLIPHVLAYNNSDDDLSYLRSIKDNISRDLQPYVSIIEEDEGFIGRKKILSQLDCVIAARMHCAINAISCGVPTILLSYSAKAKGMAEFVYGDHSMICGLELFENIGEIIKMINNRRSPEIAVSIDAFNYNALLETIVR